MLILYQGQKYPAGDLCNSGFPNTQLYGLPTEFVSPNFTQFHIIAQRIQATPMPSYTLEQERDTIVIDKHSNFPVRLHRSHKQLAISNTGTNNTGSIHSPT